MSEVPGSAAMIELKGIDFRYPSSGGFAMHIDEASIPAGDCIAIVGSAGSESSISGGSSRPTELSHGEQQRVAVCRAMLNQPALLLAASITLMLFLPAATRLLVNDSAEALTSRADRTPLVMGAAGSPLELVLSSLYFHAESPPAISFATFMDLELAEGRMMGMLGECVIGAFTTWLQGID